MKPVNNKSEITLEFLIKITLFAVVVLLFVIPLVVKLYDLIGGNAKPATINSMMLLSKEIKYLEGDTTLPLYVDDKHIIKGYDISDSEKPGICKKDLSCLCTCKKSGCSPKTIEKCVDIEYGINNLKLHLDNSFYLEPTSKVENFHVSLLAGTLSIKLTPGLQSG